METFYFYFLVCFISLYIFFFIVTAISNLSRNTVFITVTSSLIESFVFNPYRLFLSILTLATAFCVIVRVLQLLYEIREKDE